jgi:hypothetical protein
MKKYLKVVVIVIVFILFLATRFSLADLEKPVFEKGDYWEYEVILYNYYENGTQYVEGEGILKTEVVGKEKIELDGKSYDVIVINESVVINYISGEQTISVVTRYLDENSLAVLKETEQISGTWQITEAIYDPPIFYYNYPLYVGKNWIINSTVTYYPDLNTTQYTAVCECIGKQNVTTKAGEFKECYIVNRVEPSYIYNDTYLSYYFALHPDSYLCFFEEYLENITGNRVLMSYANLTSYSYNPAKKSSKTPGFESLIIFSAVLITTYIIMRKKMIL